MRFKSARAFFEALAVRGHDPRLANAVGSWELDVEGAGTWTITVDRGALRVDEGRAPPAGAASASSARIRLREDELLRLVHGDGHENLFMGLIRGALSIEGELAFAQRIQALLPISSEGSAS